MNTATDTLVTKTEKTSGGYDMGQSITDKIGFYGLATPIIQRSGSAQAAVTTTAATSTAPYGYATAAQADAVVTLANELRAALVALNLIAGA